MTHYISLFSLLFFFFKKFLNFVIINKIYSIKKKYLFKNFFNFLNMYNHNVVGSIKI